MRNFLVRIRPLALIAGFGGVLLVLGIATILDRGFGEEVRIISPHTPSTVEINKTLYMTGDSVAEIYGNPLSSPVRVIRPAADRIVVPTEDTSLVLLSVNKQLGENPLQAITVWLFAKAAMLGFGILGLAALAFPRRRVEA